MIEGCGSDEEEEENFSLPLLSCFSPRSNVADGNNRPLQAEGEVTEPPLEDHRRTIIHIDIDCFYAQVEMILNPKLRDVPLGIQQKYLLVTCNYKAREQGVTKLMSITEAKTKCPDIVIVNGEDLTKYREMSESIFDLFKTHCSAVERLGFDETFLDVTDQVQHKLQLKDECVSVNGHLYGEQKSESSECTCGCHTRLKIGSHIAAELRKTLHSALGITSSAGVAHNKMLSKLVGNVHKPNQQTTLLPEDARTLMTRLKARDIPGIGHSTAKKLQEIGVRTVQDLTACPIAILNAKFGLTTASRMKSFARGVDPTPVVLSGMPKSVSDEDSFKKCSSLDEASKTIKSLITNLLPRLKDSLCAPQTMRLTVRRYNPNGEDYHSKHRRESKQRPLPGKFFSCHDLDTKHQILLDIALELFNKLVNVQKPFHLTLINVCFANFKTPAMSSIADCLSRSSLSKKRKCEDEEPSQMLYNKHDIYSGKVTSTDRKNQQCTSLGTETHTSSSTDCLSALVQPGEKSSAEKPKHVHGTVKTLPEEVDPLLFSELPVDIQRELLSQWKPAGHDGKGATSNNGKKKLTGIRKYFGK